MYKYIYIYLYIYIYICTLYICIDRTSWSEFQSAGTRERSEASITALYSFR